MGLAGFQRARREAQAKLEAENTVSNPVKAETTGDKVNRLIRNINTISADEVRFVAKYLKVIYTTKDETTAIIKKKIGK